MTPALRTELALPFPLDLELTLGVLRRGPRDPTVRFERSTAWRATRTPEGPSTLRLETRDGDLVASAWGPGAAWTLSAVPALIGLDDDPASFRPRHPLLHAIHRRHPGLRLGRTGAVFETLLPTVLEQKVPSVEAWAAYSRLVHALGEPAPGDAGLMLPPAPDRLVATPYWAFHRFGIERRKAEIIRNAASIAPHVDAIATLAPSDARRRLLVLPGIGQWSASEVATVALGDRDSVPLRDYNLPNTVSWALAGEPRGTDERMLGLLEPYRGHRARVLRLLAAAGISAPRFGPRMPLRRFARC